MAKRNTLLRPYVSFRRNGSDDIVLHHPCEYVESDGNGGSRHFGTRQERDKWRSRQEN